VFHFINLHPAQDQWQSVKQKLCAGHAQDPSNPQSLSSIQDLQTRRLDAILAQNSID
jgi:hypothetical protein